MNSRGDDGLFCHRQRPGAPPPPDKSPAPLRVSGGVIANQWGHLNSLNSFPSVPTERLGLVCLHPCTHCARLPVCRQPCLGSPTLRTQKAAPGINGWPAADRHRVFHREPNKDENLGKSTPTTVILSAQSSPTNRLGSGRPRVAVVSNGLGCCFVGNSPIQL